MKIKDEIKTKYADSDWHEGSVSREYRMVRLEFIFVSSKKVVTLFLRHCLSCRISYEQADCHIHLLTSLLIHVAIGRVVKKK